jgi:uncharacterized membrane protein YjgN (DUF898 family)
MSSPEGHPFRFVGSGSEYFRIWATNGFLNFITLWLYSPWAKVRREQYFARNLRLANASFDYHGDPIAIFKGRLLLIIPALLSPLAPLFGWEYAALPAILGVIGLLLFPWILHRSLVFRARNHSYRNLRFRYAGKTRQLYAIVAAIILMLVVLLVLLGYAPRLISSEPSPEHAYVGLAFALPWLLVIAGVVIRFYTVANFQWGDKTFATTQTPLKLVLRCTASLVLVIAILLAGFWISLPLLGVSLIGLLWYLPALLLLVLSLGAFFKAMIHNFIWTNTLIEGNTFTSTLSPWRFALASGLVTILTYLSMGFYRPFGVVWLAQMRADSLTLNSNSGLDALADLTQTDISAFGEEAASWFDIDISL